MSGWARSRKRHAGLPSLLTKAPGSSGPVDCVSILPTSHCYDSDDAGDVDYDCFCEIIVAMCKRRCWPSRSAGV